MSDADMTEEQKKFLEECENEFRNRYSEEDKDFMKIKNMELKKPPIVDPWYIPRRTEYDWTQQNQGPRRRNHNWEHRNSEKNERLERYAGKHSYHRNKQY